MRCQKENNQKRCRCTYPSCSRKGICCECLRHHLQRRELPGCCFPPEIEKNFDRSFERFVEIVQEGRI